MPVGAAPIVPHRDAVSRGGYFMIGTVIPADMDLIGQMQPNMPVRFRADGMDEVHAARREAVERLAGLRETLG